MGRFRDNVGAIGQGYRQLLAEWDATRETWNDVIAWNFEAENLEPIARDVESLHTLLDHVASEFEAIERELARIEQMT